MWTHPGIGRYVRELSLALLKNDRSPKLLFLGGRKAAEAMPLNTAAPFLFMNARSKIYGLGEQWEIWQKSRGADLLHVPHFNVPMARSGKLVVTVHDLIYLKEANASRSRWARPYASLLMRAIEKKASTVIAVSRATKNDLLELFPGIGEDRVRVIYEAASPIFRPVDTPISLLTFKEQHSLRAPFILFVGSLRPHKNILRLIEAVAGLRRERGLPHELVIVGKSNAHSTDIREAMVKNTFVRYLGELPDKDLAYLYNLTDLFVLPSLKEGFGLPLVEAMACGAPVAAANRSSLPEVVGDAGVLFDPERVDALSEAIYNVLKNTELRKKMADQSLERSQLFSWERTAAETLEVYEKALSQGR